MFFDEIRGLYTPSYFSIRLNTPKDLEPLRNLEVKYISTYFHEYFHFLQDLTCTFCLNCSWNEYDRTLRLIKFIQQDKSDGILIPLQGNDMNELWLNLKFSREILGDKKPMKQIDDDFNIKGVVLVSKCILEGSIPDSINQFVRMDIIDILGIETSYWFGGLAIIETMTFLIQKKFFNTNDIPCFPYKAAINVAEYLSPQFKEKECFIFALCEVSLYSPYPARSFYEILLEIEENNVVIADVNDIYNLGIAHIESKWQLGSLLDKSKEFLVGTLNSLFGHDAFSDVRRWIIHLINEGVKFRKENPKLLYELYRSTDAFSPLLFKIYEKLGAPEIFNAENKRWFALPLEFLKDIDNIHPLFLIGFKQIQELLLFGEKPCKIIPYCEGVENEMPIDILCTTSPWLKANQDPLCPFAALWKSFGLEKKKLIIGPQ